MQNHFRIAVLGPLCALLVMAVAAVIYVDGQRPNMPPGENPPENPSQNRPRIVKQFACSDYCPGPASKYTVDVYEGVTTEAECNKWGGKFSSYTGWGTFYTCKVQ